MTPNINEIGFVIIGRNEGSRLKNCVSKISGFNLTAIYVDSGSSDDSVEFCINSGLDVIELDATISFSAGRARNAGFFKLIADNPEIAYVQFLDGDCQLASGWLEEAIGFLVSHPEAAIVCGRRREKNPQNSVYNRLCDMEWDTEVGETKACGGDFLVRTESMKSMGGFNESVIAGEEPELCFRIRQAGWGVWRLPVEMSLHDADIRRFGQWWRRTMRSGYAYAHILFLHWREIKGFAFRNMLSIIVLGGVFPMATIISIAYSSWCLLLSVGIIYIFLLCRIIFRTIKKKKVSLADACSYAISVLAGKLPQLMGLVEFFVKLLFGGKHEIIEYK